MRPFILLWLLCLPVAGVAGSDPITFSVNLMGHIGQQTVKMRLNRNGDHIDGYYGLANQTTNNNFTTTKNYIDGSIDKHHHVELKVSPINNSLDFKLIQGTLHKENGQWLLTGKWFSSRDPQKAKNTHKLKLKQYAISYDQYELQDKYIKQNQFKDQYCYNQYIHYPLLEHAKDSHAVSRFNHKVRKIIKNQKTKMGNALDEAIKKPLTKIEKSRLAASSSKCNSINQFVLRINYVVTNIQHAILSVQYHFSHWHPRMPHPYRSAKTLNYDLKRAQFITLGQLFKPKAQYLALLSRYAREQLRNKMFQNVELNSDLKQQIRQGTEPKKQNYQHWNLRPNGLIIHIEHSQVAPFAYGDLDVMVPAEVIKPKLRSDYKHIFKTTDSDS